MKKLLVLACLLLFASVSFAQGGDYMLVWDSNVEADLAGYRIYRSEQSGMYAEPFADVGNVTECPFNDAGWADGRYYFVATAYDAHGNESGYSNEVDHEVDHTAPAPPAGCKVIKIP